MTNKPILLSTAIFLCGFAFFSAPIAQAGSVLATGTAKIFGNDTQTAREQAIRNAQRNAIEQSLGVYVDSNTVTENWRVLQDKIYSSSKGYITDFDILEDKLSDDGTSWFVSIDAFVAEEILVDDLTALNILHKKSGNIRYAVSGNASLHTGIHPEVSRSAASKISDEFNKSGFRLFLPGETDFDSLPLKQKLRVAAANDLEMLVEFELRKPEAKVSSNSFFKVIVYGVRIRVYSVSTGEILSESESAQRHFVKSGQAPGNNLEQKVQAVRKSASTATRNTLKDIIGHYRKRDESGTVYVIIFQNYTDQNESAYSAILEEMDGFENLKEIRKLRGLLSLEYTSRLPLNTIRKRLEEAALEQGAPLKIKVGFGNRLVYVKR